MNQAELSENGGQTMEFLMELDKQLCQEKKSSPSDISVIFHPFNSTLEFSYNDTIVPPFVTFFESDLNLLNKGYSDLLIGPSSWEDTITYSTCHIIIWFNILP
jgi:hypothetical protein